MEIFHVFNRGVEKRDIFLDEEDYYRFIHDLFEFNNQNYSINNYRKFKNNINLSNNFIDKSNKEQEPRKLLVKILVFCLMKNHYHLLIGVDNVKNLSVFMQKLNIGYAMYFNEKYNRNGTLFQGKYKKILVTNHPYFLYLIYYIHLNPLDYLMPDWREKKIKDYKEAFNFLKNYKWSSHLDYLGIKNFPSVTQRDFLLKFFDNEKKYKDYFLNYLKQLEYLKFVDKNKNLLFE